MLAEKQRIRQLTIKKISEISSLIEKEVDLDDVFVKNPRDHQGHIIYDVRGKDKEGFFEGPRRYNDFNAFRQLLVARYPGLYIPKIPPKRALVSIDYLISLGQ